MQNAADDDMTRPGNHGYSDSGVFRCSLRRISWRRHLSSSGGDPANSEFIVDDVDLGIHGLVDHLAKGK